MTYDDAKEILAQWDVEISETPNGYRVRARGARLKVFAATLNEAVQAGYRVTKLERAHR